MEKETLALRNYAHIGDAVWEVFVRSYTIYRTNNAKLLHKNTTDRVNAYFQKDMLSHITVELTEQESDLVRRARNLPIPVGRKNIQSIYRQATAFEVLIGYWYIHDKQRLEYMYNLISETEFFS